MKANCSSLKKQSKAVVFLSIQSLRGTLESVERERQKLMKDLVATNQRVTVFAQDVDEQNARMEEANKEKIRYFSCRTGIDKIL
jgi:intracellular sulfur oxidation DsrE/DsrF family protein